ncbi:MAG: helix-turn-helix transcriptional regulator [Ruminococcus sp.]|nr:helix-turn-helix transcriptional regulator [Ruminococcus sp.]
MKSKIAELRTARNLTIQQLADSAGLPKRTVEEVLRRDTCSVKTAIKLADALGVTLDELCRDRTDKTE